MRIALLIFLFSSVTMANERNVVGGTILHSATAEAGDESTAAFLAQQGAIKAVITECSIAHREIKIYQSFTKKYAENKYVAAAEAGLSFEDCDEGKRAKGPNKERLTSPEIAKNQQIYEQYLEKQLGLGEKPKEVSSDKKEIAVLQQKIDNLIEKLDEKKDNEGPRVIVVREPASPAVSSTKANSSTCRAQYQNLMQQASQAATKNFPPGNMAQGEAYTLWNQAMEVKQGCP